MSGTKRAVNQQFGNVAPKYATSTVHALGEDLAWMVEAADLTGGERVLDVGTGAGHASFAIAPHVATVEGIDITPAMLEQAQAGADERGLSNIAFSLGDVEDIPRSDASYDVVISRWCAHHYADIRLAVSEIARVLKPVGVFVLIDSMVPQNARADTFVNTLEMLRDTSHVRDYSIREWLDFLETVGLHGQVLHEWGLRLDGDRWVERMNTPRAYVDAIRALLTGADDDLREAVRVTDEDDPAGWGFDLPTALIKAHRL